MFIKTHWKSIIWAIVILILCGIPGDDIDKVRFIDIPHLDKFVHGVLYFVFTLLLINKQILCLFQFGYSQVQRLAVKRI